MSNSRHCEPTGRANARPMTGSAKQSIEQQARKLDCFVAYAPVRKRFAFVAGNDGRAHFRDPAARPARVLPSTSRSLKSEGAGNAGCTMHPQPRVENAKTTRAKSPQVRRNKPAFPARWFTAYSALS